ncbi:MAG: zinc ribbon domain-containing protein [Caldilineaceae bacterium]
MSPEFVNTIATIAGVIVAIFGAFLFAFWVSMGIWTFNDIRSRSRDWLAMLLACLLVLIFPIVGLVLYMMIRPKDTLAEIYDRALEEEALLRELETAKACHQCGSPTNESWIFCPTCHAQLQYSCANCGNLVRTEWDICVMCGAAQRGADQRPADRRAPDALAADQRIMNAPTDSVFAPQTAQEPEFTAAQPARRRENPFARPTRSGD